MKNLNWTAAEHKNMVVHTARLCQYLVNSCEEVTTIYNDLDQIEYNLDDINIANNIPMVLVKGVRHDIKELNYETLTDTRDILESAITKLNMLKQLLILRQII